MALSWFDPLVFALSCLGGGGLLLSLGIGFANTQVTTGRRLLALVVNGLGIASGVFAIGAAWAKQPFAIWGSAAALLGLYLALVVLPSTAFATAASAGVQLLRCRAGRRFTMLGLWILCPFLAVGIVATQYGEVNEAEDLQFFEALKPVVAIPEPDVDSPLTTDLGRMVRTLHVDNVPLAPTPELLAAQARMIKQYELSDTVIHVPLGWQDTNCHGFVFTAGRHWVGGSQVDSILKDNGYQPVALVLANDLAIYRDRAGAVMHTGIVRGLAADGVILVESKWGQAGRFIHRHDRHVYPQTDCTFYRSARQGHLLRGVYPTPSDDTSPPPTRPTTTSATPAANAVIGL